MRIFVYEFVTGGGWFDVDSGKPPAGSLRDEGAAMVRALASDFAMVSGVEVECLADDRLGSLNLPHVSETRVSGKTSAWESFARATERADWTILIAPEFSGYLLERADWVRRAGGRLLSPDAEFIRIASDKQLTMERLSRAEVPVPRGCSWNGVAPLPEWLPWPRVIKPLDGAGSLDVRLVSQAHDLCELGTQPRSWRVEEFRSGIPASVSVLAGKFPMILPASRQVLSDDGQFRYLGGETPLPPSLRTRACQLAKRVISAFPATTGYIGVDLVLDRRGNEGRDCVIEVNPRLTTSYLGLRQITRDNLAAAMLRIALGENVELRFDDQPVRFSATPA